MASDYYDGLSFGQAARLREPMISDRFQVNETLNEPYDEIRFREGTVGPGDRLTVSFVVTDATPVPEFYLLQRPSRLISARPSRRTSPDRYSNATRQAGVGRSPGGVE